jgi:hypothetical protein
MLSSHQEQKINKRNIDIVEKALTDEENRLLDKAFIDVASHEISLAKLPLLVSKKNRSTDELKHLAHTLREIFDSSRHAVCLKKVLILKLFKIKKWKVKL